MGRPAAEHPSDQARAHLADGAEPTVPERAEAILRDEIANGALANIATTRATRAEYLASARVMIRERPELIGETSEGIVLSWLPMGGSIVGPGLRARVRPAGEHLIVVRPDGAERVRTEQWPSASLVYSAPRLLTAAPRYAWLNRLQCIGIDEVRPFEQLYMYDVYLLI